MHPALDGVLAGIGHHGLTMHMELLQAAVAVPVMEAPVRVELHPVGVTFLVLCRVTDKHVVKTCEKISSHCWLMLFMNFLILL